MKKKATAPAAVAGAAASTAPAAKLARHTPTRPRPRDEFTGKGGQYRRDPATGQRIPVTPSAAAGGDDTAAA